MNNEMKYVNHYSKDIKNFKNIYKIFILSQNK